MPVDASAPPRLRSVLSYLTTPLSIGLALLGVYIAGFGLFNETVMRVGTYALAATVLILHAYDRRYETSAKMRWFWLVDVALLIGLAFAILRYFEIGEALEIGLYSFNANDILVAVIGIVVLLELTRRAFGLPLVIVCALAIGYALYGEYLPWIFQHGGYNLDQVVQVVWYSFDGIFGGPMSVVVTLILVFVVFGIVLEGIGAGTVLLNFAFALTGRSRGGPAHAAIAASCVFGSMSGSVSGNVVGTGVMTIPMIINRGYPARYAGGIEAAASSGGQFMPPIMGAVAFIMSDVTGIPYLTICTAALLPALFYYASMFVAVHVEAVKRGIEPIPAADRPVLTRHDWLMSLCFVIPFGVVVSMLFSGRSPALAGFWAVLTALALGFIINDNFRKHPLRVFKALQYAGYACAQIIIAVGAIGIVIGVMNMTGLGLRFAGVMQAIAGDSLFLSLIMMMLGSMVLGMGMPTVPAYLIIILVMGPAIELMGVPTLIAHLFVVYFGVLSSITPPVAIAAFAAAPIARANPVSIGIDACKVAFVGFVIPFVLVYNPSLSLVIDVTAQDLIWVCVRLALSIWMLTTGFAGYAGARLPLWMRLLRIAVGLGILLPGFWLEAGVTIAAIAVSISDYRDGKQNPAAPAIGTVGSQDSLKNEASPRSTTN